MNTQLKTITAYDDFRAEVSKAKDDCNFLPDMATDEGYEKSKRVALDTGKILTAVEKTRKELKSESLAYGKMVDSEAKLIVAEIEEFQLPHKEAYKELDNIKKEREANRKAELEERVRVIRELPEAMADSDSGGVKMALESLQQEECLDFYEYATPALQARNASKIALGDMFVSKVQSEKDAAELVELRRKQAEQDQKDRDDRIAKEAAAEAEAKALAAKEAEQRAIDQAAEAVKQRELAEHREKENAKQAKIDSDAAIEAAKQAEIDRQAAEKEAERIAQEKRDKNKRHVGAVRKAAKEALMAAGLDEKTAKIVVMAINAGDIPAIAITY